MFVWSIYMVSLWHKSWLQSLFGVADNSIQAINSNAKLQKDIMIQHYYIYSWKNNISTTFFYDFRYYFLSNFLFFLFFYILKSVKKILS